MADGYDFVRQLADNCNWWPVQFARTWISWMTLTGEAAADDDYDADDDDDIIKLKMLIIYKAARLHIL